MPLKKIRSEKLVVRCPRALKGELLRLAWSADMTLSAYVISILAGHVRNRPREKESPTPPPS